MKTSFLKSFFMFLISFSIILSVSLAQEKPQKIEHPKQCKCEKCTEAKTSKVMKCKEECECPKCTKMKEMKKMKCKEGCVCPKCTKEKKMKMKEHPAKCDCKKCATKKT